ncbi:hypothetical protein PG996_002906 [Apiospora saccharicola]|uniref:Fucose-specific lectin n=1 Tax=Apiospora saccharicola TaxID=335842 RepID=A0ABR1WNR1_9PEZI
MSHSYDHHDAARSTTTTNSPSYQEQPGLEVDSRIDTTGLHQDYYAEDTTKQTVNPGDRGGYFPDEHHAAPGLQAGAPPVIEGKYDNDNGGGTLHPTAGGGAYPAETDATATPGKKPSRRRLWIILGVIAAILIIIAAVLGGILGTRASKASSPDSSSSSSSGDGDTAVGNQGNDTAPPATPLKFVRPGSSLAVTGWREGAGFHIRLFYQGPDQRLRYSNFSTTDPGGWNKQPTLLDQLEYPAGDNTSLAAGTSMESREIMGEDKLFYLDKTNTIRLQLFRKDIRAAGNPGQLNSYPAQVAPGSRLGAYWPSVLSQEPGTSGKLRWTRYWGKNAKHDFWEHQDANITASPQSGLAVVPASSKYGGAGGFIYRRGDGKVFNSLGDHYEGGFNGTAWDKGDLANNLKDLKIPDDSPLAAFTVARSGANPQNFVNTYILYVGSQGRINMLWQDDENSGWKGPSQYPKAFGGADEGTDIACLTPATWKAANVDELTGAYDMSRCYFQAGGGRVREVRFDGSEWRNLGYLPID